MKFKNIIKALSFFCLIIVLLVILSIIISGSSGRFIHPFFLLLLTPFLILITANSVISLRYLKKDTEIAKREFKKYYLNIYWKKVLLFLSFFKGVDILLKLLFGVIVSVETMGFPLTYYHSYDYAVFYPIAFIFNIIFYWIIAGLIVKGPEKINKITTTLNYLILFIALYFILKDLRGIVNIEFMGFI